MKQIILILILTLTLCLMSCSQPERTPEEISRIVGDYSNPIKFDYNGQKNT